MRDKRISTLCCTLAITPRLFASVPSSASSIPMCMPHCRGDVICLKLSPNLRTSIAPPPPVVSPEPRPAAGSAGRVAKGLVFSAAALSRPGSPTQSVARVDPVRSLEPVLASLRAERDRMVRHGMYLY